MNTKEKEKPTAPCNHPEKYQIHLKDGSTHCNRCGKTKTEETCNQ